MHQLQLYHVTISHLGCKVTWLATTHCSLRLTHCCVNSCCIMWPYDILVVSSHDSQLCINWCNWCFLKINIAQSESHTGPIAQVGRKLSISALWQHHVNIYHNAHIFDSIRYIYRPFTTLRGGFQAQKSCTVDNLILTQIAVDHAGSERAEVV